MRFFNSGELLLVMPSKVVSRSLATSWLNCNYAGSICCLDIEARCYLPPKYVSVPDDASVTDEGVHQYEWNLMDDGGPEVGEAAMKKARSLPLHKPQLHQPTPWNPHLYHPTFPYKTLMKLRMLQPLS